MNETLSIIVAAVALLALGIWLMMPRGRQAGRAAGTLLTCVALGLVASQIPRVGDLAASIVFYILAAVTVLSAVATITFRNPVYSAIWFALSLLGTAGLFLFDGAQFLGVATIVVYAGAILVTFLFVLMLAQPRGHAAYDRTDWSAPLAAVTGAAMVGILTICVAGVFQNPDEARRPHAAPPPEMLEKEILNEHHMALLGGQLFSRYLVAVEVAGTLLLVALVGTVAIVAQIKKPNEGPWHE